MKTRWLLLAVLVLLSLLAACGGGGGGNEPTDPVKAFLEALEKKDARPAVDLSCKEQREGVETFLEGFLDLYQTYDDNAKFEFIDVEYQVEDQTDNEARVTISGRMKSTVFGETFDEELSGGWMSDSFKVIKEDGKWVLCNPEFSVFVGQDFTDALGEMIEDVFEDIADELEQ